MPLTSPLMSVPLLAVYGCCDSVVIFSFQYSFSYILWEKRQYWKIT